MGTGAITGYIDVAQLVLYAFWIFFAGLVIYLRREDKREGYPLVSERSERIQVQGWPAVPGVKTYRLPHGHGTKDLPDAADRDPEPTFLKPSASFPGAPLVPIGDPIGQCVGPGSYATRSDRPDMTWDGKPRIVPLRILADHGLDSRDPDPRGMPVVGVDREVGGKVVDAWIDRSEPHVRYLELEVAGQRRVLLPIYFAKIDRRRGHVRVDAIRGEHFAKVPGLANPDQVTLAEEDRISGYYGGGTLYATESRAEPWL